MLYTPVVAPSSSPLDRHHMPTSFEISVDTRVGTARPRERRQRMRGFDERYVDIVDYIVGITEEIWDRKNLGYLHECYASDIFRMEENGPKIGRAAVLTDSAVVLQSMPDVATFADECIWAGDDEVGFHTSHRGPEIGRNTGASVFGSATNTRIATWSMANCVAKDNYIYEEWELANTGSVIRALGLNIVETARRTASERSSAPFTEYTERIDRFRDSPPAQAVTPDGGFDPDAFARFLFHSIWNRRNLHLIDSVYSPTVRFHGPTDRELYGRAQVTEFVLSLLGTFPDLALTVDEIYWMGNDIDGYRISTRWSAVGTHTGPALYGSPTGREVFIWGITQQYITRATITEEWTLFNEFHIMQELFRDE